MVNRLAKILMIAVMSCSNLIVNAEQKEALQNAANVGSFALGAGLEVAGRTISASNSLFGACDVIGAIGIPAKLAGRTIMGLTGIALLYPITSTYKIVKKKRDSQ